MALRELPDPQLQNQDAYDDLMVAIEASEGALSLLIAVCDDSNLRDEIIGRYEAELEAKVRCYRVQLNREEPSLKRAIAQTVESDEYLQQGGRAVFTVLGADTLLRIHLRADEPGQTQLEKFLGYLQWTREGLREFRYPILLWVTYSMLTQISTKSPDFWSWRKGVFRFTSSIIPSPVLRTLIASPTKSSGTKEGSLLSIEDLENLITETEEAQGIRNPLLPNLYTRLAQAYKQRIEQGETTDLKQDFYTAIDYLKKALSVGVELDLQPALVDTLASLGLLYYSQGQFKEAIQSYQTSLTIAQHIGDRVGESSSLMGLGDVYHSLREYQQAIELYRRSLEIARDISDHKHEAAALGSLGNAYHSLGQYQQAIEFYQQSLEIQRDISDHEGEASSLNNLGNAYYSLGQYQQAIEFLQRSLEIFHQIGDLRGEASSLNNLGNVFRSLLQHQQAIEFYQRSLEIFHRIGALLGEANALSNLGATCSILGQTSHAVVAYQSARDLYEQMALESDIQKTDKALQELAAKPGG